MTTKQEAVGFCLGFDDVYEDYPFSDKNWCVIRHKDNKKVFAWIFEKDGKMWINVKCLPEMTSFWRNSFKSVIPAYHLNKEHWNSVILDGSVPKSEICTMVADSYNLTKPKRKKKTK